MLSAEQILQTLDLECKKDNKILNNAKVRGEKDFVVQELYKIYCSSNSISHRKIENWKRYVRWLKDTKQKNTKDSQLQFQKQKIFIKQLELKSFAIMLSKYKIHQLYEILAEAKDKDKLGKDSGGYIVGQFIRFRNKNE